MAVTVRLYERDPDFKEALIYEFQKKSFALVEGHADVLVVAADYDELMKGYIRDLRGCADRWILLVSYMPDMCLSDAYALGAEAVFEKPFSRHALTACIERLTVEREFPRIDRVYATVKVSVRTHGVFTVTNMGMGGMFIENVPLQVEERIYFRIQSAFMPHLEGEAICRWVRVQSDNGRQPGCGLEFVNVSPERQQAIILFMNWLRTEAV